jgi:HlyD family secretion protein
MRTSPSPLFRGQALSRLSSPDDLDTLLVVVNSRGWIALGACCLVCSAALGWTVFGKIPVTVEGVGVLVNPGNVKGLQTVASGQLTELGIRAGQRVNKGETIAQLSQPEINKEIALAGAKLTDLVDLDKATSALERERWESEQKTATNQTNLLNDEIQKSRALADSLLTKSTGFNAQQRVNLDKSKQVSQRLFAAFQERFEAAKGLRRDGAISIDGLLESETKLRDIELTVASHDVKVSELAVLEIESATEFQRQQNRIADLALKQQEIDISQQRLRQELLEKKSAREHEISETRRRIERLHLDLTEQSEVRSEFTGRVLEVSVTAGQVITSAMRLGTIEIDDTNRELKNLAYFAIKDGKRIYPGMAVRITPSTVERARFGSIIGRVTKCSEFPITTASVVNVVGNQEVASQLAQEGGVIEVEIELQRDLHSASGYKWTSRGPEIQFSAGTTTRVSVTAEERAPITWLIPLLRSWMEGQENQTANRR